MSRSLSAQGSCHACRFSPLDTFAALAGLPLRTCSAPGPRMIQHLFQQRKISSSRILRSETIPSSTSSSEAWTPSAQPSDSSIPWYLRVEPPTPLPPIDSSSPSHHFTPDIPPLPENPPAILSPVLHTLYQTLGLDAISLLDLRHLISPPPALGANLIMILATARSIKHLNVSADRFCRWCRATYKLRPYADGLLGRNELKLKLRRKARRQRLAASVGNTVNQDGRGLGSDDGITTGWICVNLGPVDEVEMPTDANEEEQKNEIDEEEEEEYQNPPDGFVGFGSRSTAPRIVVQMFTEEKRAEMDLEGLWGVRQTRRSRKDEAGIAEAESAVARRQSDVAWGRDSAGKDSDL